MGDYDRMKFSFGNDREMDYASVVLRCRRGNDIGWSEWSDYYQHGARVYDKGSTAAHLQYLLLIILLRDLTT